MLFVYAVLIRMQLSSNVERIRNDSQGTQGTDRPSYLLHYIFPYILLKIIPRYIDSDIQTQPAFKPFRTIKFDTLKIYCHAQGFKVRAL